MVRDFRPLDLETVHTEKVTHRLEITHLETGVRVTGTGENRYALECKLLELLHNKLEDIERDEQTSEELPPCLQ